MLSIISSPLFAAALRQLKERDNQHKKCNGRIRTNRRPTQTLQRPQLATELVVKRLLFFSND